MSLLSIFDAAPESVHRFNIEQVVSAAGDGILKDGSSCSRELRDYLGIVPTEKIAEYVSHCLTSAFARSGIVLQDLINQLGSRLDYEVSHGRYQGVVNEIGYDGIWTSPEGHSLVVEVKTTDAYRMPLDNLAGYRRKLTEAGKLQASSSILIVVGRQDTGELEAQIRGSRHAWDIRVISAEALVKLVSLNENAESDEIGLKIRSLLTPIEYTRLDQVVDVVFATRLDSADRDTQEDDPVIDDAQSAKDLGSPLVLPEKSSWVFTDSQILEAKRDRIISSLSEREGVSFVRKSPALRVSRTIRVACAVSKLYTGKNQAPYWYAYHERWNDFLSDSAKAYFVLGCMDRDEAYAIPLDQLQRVLDRLNTTTKASGSYWHIHLVKTAEGLGLVVPKSRPLSLLPFRLPLKGEAGDLRDSARTVLDGTNK